MNKTELVEYHGVVFVKKTFKDRIEYRTEMVQIHKGLRKWAEIVEYAGKVYSTSPARYTRVHNSIEESLQSLSKWFPTWEA